MADAEFEGEAFMTNLERAIRHNEGVSNLDKTEAIYYVAYQLTGEMPEGHPSDHNGNVTRETIKAWAEALAEDS